MAAGRYSFVIEVGADFSKSVTWMENGVAVNLTGYTGLMQVRQTPSSAVLLEFTTDNATMDIDGPNGIVALHQDDSVTALLSWQSRAYYDLVLTGPTPDFVVVRLLEGRVELSPQVSH